MKTRHENIEILWVMNIYILITKKCKILNYVCLSYYSFWQVYEITVHLHNKHNNLSLRSSS